MSALDQAGTQPNEIASLWDLFMGVAAVAWVLVIGFLIAAAVVAQRRRAPATDAPLIENNRARARRRRRAVIAAGGLTVVALFGLLIASTGSSAALVSLEDDPDALRIEVTGHQWWWEIEYWPGDPRRVATTANELYIPVDTPIHLELASVDVIHSFWVPSLHGKKDLIPGRKNRTWLRADQPGVYRGQCGEYCGLEHAKMAISVIAVPPAEFEAWLARQRRPAPAPVTDQQRRGQQVFLGGPCALCHTISGTPAGGRLGPDLTHLSSRSTLGAGAVPNTVGHLTGWIVDPGGIKPGVRMPSTALSAEELHALVAYLEALR